MTYVTVVMILAPHENWRCLTTTSCFAPPGFYDTHFLVFLLTHQFLVLCWLHLFYWTSKYLDVPKLGSSPSCLHPNSPTASSLVHATIVTPREHYSDLPITRGWPGKWTLE